MQLHPLFSYKIDINISLIVYNIIRLSMPCLHSTKESKCKKLTPVEQITNRCTTCQHLFCPTHYANHGMTCTKLDERRAQALSTLKTQLVQCVEDKIERI
jgi:hypothetical protein